MVDRGGQAALAEEAGAVLQANRTAGRGPSRQPAVPFPALRPRKPRPCRPGPAGGGCDTGRTARRLRAGSAGAPPPRRKRRSGSGPFGCPGRLAAGSGDTGRARRRRPVPLHIPRRFCLVRSSVFPQKVTPPIFTDRNRCKSYKGLQIYFPSAENNWRISSSISAGSATVCAISSRSTRR